MRLRWEFVLNGMNKPQGEHAPAAFLAERDGDIDRAVKLFTEANLPYDAAMALLCNASQSPSEYLRKSAEILFKIDAKAALDKCYRLAGVYKVTSSMPSAKRGPHRAARNHPLNLTKRELEVLRLVSEGHSNKSISNIFNRSHRTVDQHVSSILKKLSVASRVEAILKVKAEPWIIDNQDSRVKGAT